MIMLFTNRIISIIYIIPCNVFAFVQWLMSFYHILIIYEETWKKPSLFDSCSCDIVRLFWTMMHCLFLIILPYSDHRTNKNMLLFYNCLSYVIWEAYQTVIIANGIFLINLLSFFSSYFFPINWNDSSASSP